MAGSGIIPAIARILRWGHYVPQADVGPEPIIITVCNAGMGCGNVLEDIGHEVGSQYGLYC